MTHYDVAVIGGGPAGAQAAFKAALLHKTCIWFDKGRRLSRIYWSPRVDNLPGRFGESGREIIEKGYATIREYEADQQRSFVTVHENTDVTRVTPAGNGFQFEAEGPEGLVKASASTFILAAGAVDRQPVLRDFRKRDIEAILPYANKGLADYCLLCDGHTVKDKRVAVLGCGPGAASIAASLKDNFGADTAVVAACGLGHPDALEHTDEQWNAMEARLAKRNIPILRGLIREFTGIRDGQFSIVFEDGSEEAFDKAWISMGWYKVNGELAEQVGAVRDQDGFVITDADGRMLDQDGASIPGAYAVGDVRSGSWKQIPIAWGDAERAVIDAFIHHL